MALIVENGTGLATAESYASVAQASARMTALGNDTWATITTAQMEEALRRATAYMVQAYRNRWAGTRLLRAQALDWPRYGVSTDGFTIESTIVPTEVVNACIDLALKAAAGDLNADLTRAIIREKVGPLETEYSAHGAEQTRYRSIDMALAPFLRWGGTSARLVRT